MSSRNGGVQVSTTTNDMLNSYAQNHGSIWQNGSMDNADIVAIRQNMACEATAVIADAVLHMIFWMKINFSFSLSDVKKRL